MLYKITYIVAHNHQQKEDNHLRYNGIHRSLFYLKNRCKDRDYHHWLFSCRGDFLSRRYGCLGASVSPMGGGRRPFLLWVRVVWGG